MLLNSLAAVPLLASGLTAAPALPDGFVDLRRVAPSVLHDIRYQTAHNFVGRPIDGYRAPKCLLTKKAATALAKAQRALVAKGYTLKVYDCYRPQRAVNHFVRWAEDVDDQRMKREFYPWMSKTRLFSGGYIAKKSGHSRGSTVDLTLVKLPARAQRPYVPGEPLQPCTGPQARRFPDNSVDMGTGYDCFDSLANTADPRVTGQAKANRKLLKTTLERQGFANYSKEWWHFTLKNEPFPNRYFDFPVQ
ncbi:M15 family metallopeptidase [Actinomadura kijaniata]|uniref:D-alanyl-D-alanine dipeptidase n=1 Tax=Actinomadura namibiensis TaxID=182080 RepID=A0A7W3QKU4_ACTNM|nr:M15 family metallopeptidase [Actinomadura namibiensis]MBA8950278.1 D-alanyl-D-alanine dipeptidase [Actinomadura namibiensis]